MTAPQTHGRGAGRSRLVEEIEEILRRQFGWNEVMMSNIMWRFIGVDVNAFLDYGIDPNAWLQTLSNLSINDPYWLGVQDGDLYIRKRNQRIDMEMHTTNPIDAVFFAILMRTITTPSIDFSWTCKRRICLSAHYRLSLERWPWYGMDYRIISNFDTNNVLKYIAGLIDTDGTVSSHYVKQSGGYRLEIRIYACRKCVNVLMYVRDVIYERLGVEGRVLVREDDSALQFRNYQAVELLRRIRQYVAHPLKRLNAETYLKYYNKVLTVKEYRHLREQLKYNNNGNNDPKRCRLTDMLTRAAPQTHTHGERFKNN